jgi:hypothetical protein
MRAPRQTEITVDCDLNITVTKELGQRSGKSVNIDSDINRELAVCAVLV